MEDAKSVGKLAASREGAGFVHRSAAIEPLEDAVGA
jgi:hypothetical protein